MSQWKTAFQKGISPMGRCVNASRQSQRRPNRREGLRERSDPWLIG